MNGVEELFPLVNLEGIYSSDEAKVDEAYLQVGKEIVEAFQEHGYVYLQNAGLQEKTVFEFLDNMKSLFQLDSEIKQKYPRNIYTLNGYATDKKERISTDKTPQSERETFDFSRDPLFPEEVPGLRDAQPKLLNELRPLAQKIIKALELALEIPGNQLQKYHEFGASDNLTQLRVLKYAPVLKNEGQIRIKEHVDASTITFQIFESASGLQVQHKNGKWQNAQLSPKTILLFPSEGLQILTGDRILGANHRVTVPQTEELRKQDRFSFIYFVLPNDSAVMKPFDGSDKYTPMSFKTMRYRAMERFAPPESAAMAKTN